MFRIIFAAALLCAPSLAYAETCIASHYGVGEGYGGRRTANGEIMNPRAMTVAHKTRRFGSRVTVTHLGTGRSIEVRVNDRGPFVRGRCIDLSYGAAKALGMGGTGCLSSDHPQRSSHRMGGCARSAVLALVILPKMEMKHASRHRARRHRRRVADHL